MAEQRFWEDIVVDAPVPPLMKNASPRQLVQWAGASGDYYEIHYNDKIALANMLPGIIVHGALKGAWLGQLLSDWVGDKGRVKKYSASYRSMDVPGDNLTLTGKVTKKYVDGKDHVVEAEIWVQNGKGEKTTPGTAVVVFPSKK
jgi:acyl dehydratase